MRFWTAQIQQAKQFYEWYQNLVKLRYQTKASSSESSSIKDADAVLNLIMGLALPEVDRDQYNPAQFFGVTIQDFALDLAQKFISRAIPEAYPQTNQGTLSSGSFQVHRSQDADKSDQGSKQLPEKEQPPKANAQEAADDEEFEDDGKNGITFSSFEILEVLGEGSFGKVYKVALKSDPSKLFAMKVLSKQQLVKNSHLKYAISECQIMKKVQHPFVLNMKYSFQTPKNLYMIL